MERGGYVYIISNETNKVLYTGVTSSLVNRINEHRSKKYINSFSSRYNLNKLVYYKGFHSIEEAINAEKRIKAGSRKKKIDLIEQINPGWLDLYNELVK